MRERTEMAVCVRLPSATFDPIIHAHWHCANKSALKIMVFFVAREMNGEKYNIYSHIGLFWISQPFFCCFLRLFMYLRPFFSLFRSALPRIFWCVLRFRFVKLQTCIVQSLYNVCTDTRLKNCALGPAQYS